MKVFLSYSRDDLDTAKRIAANLKQAGHKIFFDQHSIQVAEDFNRIIWSEIQKADLFVFLISANSVQAGSYALTELSLAEKKWPNPEKRVLPVVIQPIDFADIPIYPSLCHVLQPEGDIAAEVRVEVNSLLKRHRLKKIALCGAVGLVLSVITWFSYMQYQQTRIESIRAELKEQNIFYPKYFIQAVTEEGDFETAQAFLDAGMGPDSTNQKGNTALCFAAKYGDIKALEFLLKAGADVNANNEKGCISILWAIGQDQLDAVHFLLNNGVNLQIRNEAFVSAASSGNIDIIKIIHDAGVDLKITGPSAMHWAARFGNSKADANTIRYLLELGIDPNVQENKDKPIVTAIISASLRSSSAEELKAIKDKLKVLLEAGADINAKCNKCFVSGHRQMTSLMTAVYWNNLEIAEMLLQYNPDLNAECNLEYTVLTIAKSSEMTELLQKVATDRKIKLGYGKGAPISLANGNLLSKNKVRVMNVKNDFFNSKSNRTGKGIKHAYEQKVQDNAIIIFDGATGLTWLKNALKGNGIDDAVKSIQQLNTEKYAGYDNWGLPTLQEAMTLVERESHENLHIDPIFSPENSSTWTSDFRSPSTAWVVNFYDATIRAMKGTNGGPSTLAVRKPPEPS